MSRNHHHHSREKKQTEALCRNCGTDVTGQFCHFCGQRYHEHKESFGELVYEFTSDFLHFDSRFFRTVFPLLFKPGRLTKDFNDGKQRSQFHPIRLYLFCSFVYFLLFFAFNKVETEHPGGSQLVETAPISDTVKHQQADSLNVKAENVLPQGMGSQLQDNKEKAGKNEGMNLNITISPIADSLAETGMTPDEYIKWQKSLAGEQRAGYLERIATMRILGLNLHGAGNRKAYSEKVVEIFLHNLPKVLFFLLPVFALLLKLLYVRKKQFYFVDHAVLSLHYFSTIFMMMVLGNYVLDKIFGTGIFIVLAIVWIMIWLLVAMKRLYGQGWFKTIGKYFILGFTFFIIMAFALFLNVIISALILA